jgi:hypothetical protein
MRKRDAPSATQEPARLRHIAARLWLLPMVSLVAICVHMAYNLPDGFHLPVIAAGAYSLFVAISWPLRCSRASVLAFVATAVAANLGMVYIHVEIVRTASGILAIAYTVLFTGAIGLLLVARTRTKLSLKTKVPLMVAMVAACLAWPLMHLSGGVEEGLLGVVYDWFFVATLPFLVLTLGMFLVLLAAHESEQTLPSDKWV